jgi:hypothetical protein
MVTDREIHTGDIPLLKDSLARDEHHNFTKPEFFFDPWSVCKVYEDEEGPICFVRGSKALRLDIQYVSNADAKRNVKAMLEFDKLAAKARSNGFTEIVFTTNSPPLKKFCMRRFGFIEECGELRKIIK